MDSLLHCGEILKARRKFPRKLYLYFLYFLPAFLYPTINQNGDFQIWDRVFLEKPITEKWKFLTVIEQRWGDNATKLFFTYIQPQIAYIPAEWVIIAPGYRQVYQRYPVASNHWRPQYSPLIDVQFRVGFAGWKIEDRNRVQYRILKGDPSHWLYRNRFRITTPDFLQKPKMCFFTDNEVFWYQITGISEDRFSTGFMMHIYGNIAGDLFYMARFQKLGSEWIHQNILNISLLFAF